MGLRSGAHLPPHQDALGLGLRGVEAGPDTWASLEVAHEGFHAGDVAASPHLGVGTSVGSVQEGPRGKGPCGAGVPEEGGWECRTPSVLQGAPEGGGPRRPQGVQGVPWEIAVPPPPPSSDPRTLPSVISPPPALLLSQSPSAVLTAGRGGGVGWDIATSGHDRDSRSRS